jgi:hypothetical protein
MDIIPNIKGGTHMSILAYVYVFGDDYALMMNASWNLICTRSIKILIS